MGFGCLKKPELRGFLYRENLRFIPILFLSSIVPALAFKFFYSDPKKKREEEFIKYVKL